jgi:hypothetical protein
MDPSFRSRPHQSRLLVATGEEASISGKSARWPDPEGLRPLLCPHVSWMVTA